MTVGNPRGDERKAEQAGRIARRIRHHALSPSMGLIAAIVWRRCGERAALMWIDDVAFYARASRPVRGKIA